VGLGRRRGFSIIEVVARGHRIVLHTFVVVNHVPSLGRLQHTPPEEGEASPPITLTFHELQAMDLTCGDAVAPVQREPCSDRDDIIFQSPRDAGELVDAAVSGFGHPCLQILAPALPCDGQKGLDQLVDPCHLCIDLAELLNIELRVLGPFRGGADEGERYRTRRGPGRQAPQAAAGEALPRGSSWGSLRCGGGFGDLW
jgi:hypothetical protein